MKSIGPDMDREIMDFYNVRITFLKTLIKLVNEVFFNLILEPSANGANCEGE